MAGEQTRIPEPLLVQLRAAGLAAGRGSTFVDPVVVHRCLRVIERRGEGWARSVLGHDLARRSIADARWPYLVAGEDHAILAADVEEDRVVAAVLDPDGSPS